MSKFKQGDVVKLVSQMDGLHPNKAGYGIVVGSFTNSSGRLLYCVAFPLRTDARGHDGHGLCKTQYRDITLIGDYGRSCGWNVDSEKLKLASAGVIKSFMISLPILYRQKLYVHFPSLAHIGIDLEVFEEVEGL